MRGEGRDQKAEKQDDHPCGQRDGKRGHLTKAFVERTRSRQDDCAERDECGARNPAARHLSTGAATDEHRNQAVPSTTEHHQCPSGASDPSKQTGGDTEHLFALRQAIAWDRSLQRSGGEDATAENGGGNHKGPDVADPCAGAHEFQLADREKGHIDDRPEQVEQAEISARPSACRTPRKGQRADTERSQGEGPRALVWPAFDQPAFVGHERKHQRHHRGGRSEGGGEHRPKVPESRPCERVHNRRIVAIVSRSNKRIPDATVARLPLYHRALVELLRSKRLNVSSVALAELTGVNAAKVRKDLSYLGTYGTRGVGYDVENLLHQISRELGLTQNWPVVIVGIGNLGRALAAYGGFSARGFRIAALLDADPTKSGDEVAGVPIRPTADLPNIVAEFASVIGVIATPGGAAQEVSDLMVTSGITSILNFSPAVLAVPDDVTVRRVDLAVELQILSFHQQHRGSNDW